jgi:Fe-S oxidoreductase/nitrate reductase gamma subunit
MITPPSDSYNRALGVYSDQYWIMYLAAAVAFSIFLYGLKSRFGLWKLGKGRFRDGMGQTGLRIQRLIKSLFGQKAVLRDRLPGWAHLSVIAGVVFFTIGTLTIAIEEHFGIPLFRGSVYLAESLIMDVMAALSLAGVTFFLWRRLVQKPDGLNKGRGDIIVLSLWGFILFSGLALEGVRMSLEPDAAPLFSPGGAVFSSLLDIAGMENLKGTHALLWWLHMGSAFSFIAIFPWTRMMHAIAAPINQYLAPVDDFGTLHEIDFDGEGPFGALSVDELHCKQLLELDACAECGRCQRACPAYLSGKTLSPEKIGTDLRLAFLAAGKRPAEKMNLLSMSAEDHGGFLEDEDLWSCSTCRACEIQCPVDVEHVRRIIDIRRALVMMLARLPEDIRTAFRNLETSGNPWNFPSAQRLDWVNDMDIPLAKDGCGPATVLWTGCVMSLDQESRSTIRTIARTLRDSGIEFEILGGEESCCGDPARRLGNEFLFQELARKNIEMLIRKKVERIITPCPHCFHVLSSEYPDFGLQIEVVHHSQLIADGRRSFRDKSIVRNPREKGWVTFHDPCYLARYGPGTDHIRQFFFENIDERYRDLPRRGNDTFCCGAGGGRFWIDDEPETRINSDRCREIMEADVQTVVTACPYCRIMIRNGLTEKNVDSIRVLDVAEYLDENIVNQNRE